MINVKWRGTEVKGEKALGQEEDGEKEKYYGWREEIADDKQGLKWLL